MEDEKKQTIPRKKKSLWRKIRFYFWAVIVLSLWIFNNHCASIGVPQWIQNAVVDKFEKTGIHVSAEEVSFSFTEGFLFRDFEFHEKRSGIHLSAPVVFAKYSPEKILSGIFLPVHFVIRNGTAVLPVLPETGEEGKMDHVKIHQLNAEFRGIPGQVEVYQASARIGKNRLRMKGSINNLLHIVLEKIFTEYWEEDMTGEKWKKTQYPYGILQIFPLDIREKFIQSYRNYEKMAMNGNPECDITFYLDLNDFKQCTVDAEIRLPEFQYEGITVHSIREHLSLKDGIVSLREVKLDVGKGSSMTVTGIYDDNGAVFRGKIKGNCSISELMKLTGNTLPPELEKHIVFKNDTVLFEGSLDHFSVSGKRFDTAITLTLPEITVDGVPLKNVELSVRGINGKLQGEIRHAELERDCHISGSFSIDSSSGISCSLQGKARLTVLQNAVPREYSAFITEKISFPGKEAPMTFSSHFKISNLKRKLFSGAIHLNYPQICINGEKIRDIEALLEFTPEVFRIAKYSANTPDGSRFSGNVEFDLNRKHIKAETVASGVPGRLAKTFDTISQTDSLTELAADISSTDPNGIAECDVDFFADYGKKPFYRVAGNAVMKNPIYCGIPFRYGAARFITDSTNRVVLPDLILKADYGTMQLESIYHADPRNADGGQMYFKLKSTLKGNDLLTLFCPDFEPVLVDFPFPMEVDSSGVIDYSDESKISVRAAVKNGDCTFSGVRVRDIDAVVFFKNGEVSFRNAEVTLAKGVCHSDFRYNFTTQKGSFRQKLEGADLAEIFREFHITEFVPAGTGAGKVSFSSDGTFYLNPGNKLMINGSGDLLVKGDDLWNIPLFESMRKMVSEAWPMIGKGIGITQVSCKLVYKDDRALIRNFKSNGSFVSMDTFGEYSWESGEYDLTVRAELLKDALPFEIASTILKPISWILSKNYKGKYIPPENQK